MSINKDLVAASSTALVLAILAEGDSYGYAILKRVRELSGGELEWTDGMLYPVLHRLERSGLVESRWAKAESGRQRKYYRITEAGRGQLADERRQWRTVDKTLGKIWSAMATAGRHGTPVPLSSGAEPWTERTDNPAADSLEKQIEAWRAHLRKSQAITSQDAAELEDHLREQIAIARRHDGLSEDEAFLVAVKRIGAIDALTREFAREHSDRLWKQLVLSGDEGAGGAESPAAGWSRRMWVALALAVAAAVAIKIPSLFGIDVRRRTWLRVLRAATSASSRFPFIAAYFAWDRPLPRSRPAGARCGLRRGGGRR